MHIVRFVGKNLAQTAIGSNLGTALQIKIGGFVNNVFPIFARNFNGFCNRNRCALTVAKDYGKSYPIFDRPGKYF